MPISVMRLSFGCFEREILNDKFRKGMLSVLQADDQLMHLQWKDRGTGTVEVSLPFFS